MMVISPVLVWRFKLVLVLVVVIGISIGIALKSCYCCTHFANHNHIVIRADYSVLAFSLEEILIMAVNILTI